MKKQSILCPVDFSGSSAPAVNLAAKLAASDGSKILMLHVIAPNEPSMSLDEVQARRFSTRIADQFLSQRDIEFEHFTLSGKPSEAIVDFAKKRSVGLIVMGTHGRTGLARVVVGSVAHNVMTHAHCPVVTVKMPAKQNSGSSNPSLVAEL